MEIQTTPNPTQLVRLKFVFRCLELNLDMIIVIQSGLAVDKSHTEVKEKAHESSSLYLRNGFIGCSAEEQSITWL